MSTRRNLLEANRIDTTEYVDTPVIQKLKQELEKNENKDVEIEAEVEVNVPRKRGRKQKYFTDEERIKARRAQQKAYRERKKQELAELRARVEAYESKNK